MRFFIDQHGCAKNQVDGELIINLLKKQDWEQSQKKQQISQNPLKQGERLKQPK